jgi:hypothetical protein
MAVLVVYRNTSTAFAVFAWFSLLHYQLAVDGYGDSGMVCSEISMRSPVVSLVFCFASFLLQCTVPTNIVTGNTLNMPEAVL